MNPNGQWNDDVQYYCGEYRLRHFACEIPLTTSEIPNWTNEWSTGAFGDSLFLTLTSDTTIFLTVTNDTGGTCTFSQSVAINVFPGCTHENATNYDTTATIEDGSCLYNQDAFDAGYEAGVASVECPPCANSDCPGDFTADGYIGVDDILAMLSLYDTSCSE